MQRPQPLVAILVLAALALGALGVANLIDEELTPEARALYAPPPQRPIAPESGWVLLAGFDAPAGVDPRAYAESHRRTSPRTLTGGKSLPRDAHELDISAAAEVLCIPQRRDCVRAFAAKPDFIDAAVADNAVLLARYDELLRSPHMGDPTEIGTYDLKMPSALLMRTQALRMSQVAVAAGRGQMDSALSWLAADAAFDRRWLEESEGMFATTIAIVGLNRTLLVAGQVARAAATITPADREALDRIAAPLSTRQRRIAPIVLAEAASFQVLVDDLAASPRKTGELAGFPPLLADLAGRALLRNATLNFAVPRFGPWLAMDALPSDAIPAAIERLRAATTRHLEPDWSWAYNFAGRHVVARENYDMGNYVYRLRDADAYAAMMRCAVALKASRIAQAAAGEFVAADPACRDPYLARPFQWDAERGELSFKAGFDLSVDRLGGANGRVTFAPYRAS